MDTRLKKFKYTGTSKERRGEGGTTGPIYELVLLCQTFILFFVLFFFYVLMSLGFIYGAHLSVYTIWPI